VASYQVGCDIGGTFTDVVVVDENGTVLTDKADSTPDDLSRGLLQALDNVAGQLGVDSRALLAATKRFVNGTTVVTNCIAELKGARVGLITTRGFGDNLLIARSARNAYRDHTKQVNVPQLVPRDLVVEVDERIDKKGTVVVPLRAEDAARAVDALIERGVESIAISLLWSFANPVHEEALADLVRTRHPGMFVSVASRLHPVIREYERTMTTVLNSFTGLNVVAYTGHIERLLADRGLTVPVTFMQGFGGTLSAAEARDRPINLVDSGPAGGVIGAQRLAARLGIADIVTADMGGTSFDVSVLPGNRTSVTTRVMLRDQFLTAVSKIDVLPVGAGGGSLAWIDVRGVPQVGPHSAGAEPGPACYGRGGTEPTVTDAVAVLGLLDAGAFLGGRRRLDTAAAKAAVERVIGRPLGLDADHAAAAIYRVVTANMSNAVRAVTVQRGHDPRHFVLCAYGGALGLFACDIAKTIGISKVVVAAEAPVFSAYGLLASDDIRTQSRSVMWGGGEAKEVVLALHEIEDELVVALHAQGYPDDRIEIEWQGDFKFTGQTWDLRVPIPRSANLSSSDLEDIQEGFAAIYEAEYGEGTAWQNSPVILLAVRVIARGLAEHQEPARWALGDPTSGSAARIGGREVFLAREGRRATAILEHPLTTIQLSTGWTATVDAWRNLVLVDHADGPPGASAATTVRSQADHKEHNDR
jgi:N-methylhydantoinase A